MRLLCSLLLLSTAFADSPPGDSSYRRAQVRAALQDGEAVVLHGAPEPTDLHDRFFQEANFLYLTNWREPGAALVFTRDSETIYLPPRSKTTEAYEGRRTAPGDPDAAKRTGFTDVRPIADLKPPAKTVDATPLITKLRLVKDAREISLIENATRATIAGHLASWARIRPGVMEYQIAATLTNTYFEHGCERNAYPPIVGSGPNSTILHYSALERQLQPNETVVMDVGAECLDYATDITRTVPTSGKFTSRQRELYNIVLAAQKAAIAAVRPGMSFYGEKSLYKIAFDYIDTHGKDQHGDPLGKYMIHGLGHYVGLDVHDPGSFNEPLQPGMVITIEPGVYLPEENIGIRIEDVVLVTETGARVLSSALPKEIEEIEKRVGR